MKTHLAIFLSLVLAAPLMAQDGAAAGENAAYAPENPATKHIADKLDALVIPKIEWRMATVREGMDFLQSHCWEMDDTETDQTKRGVRCTLKESVAPGGTAGSQARITLSLKNVPLSEAFRYVADLTGMKAEVNPDGVTLLPLSAPDLPGFRPVHYQAAASLEEINGKLKRIVLSSIEIRDATTAEVVAALRAMSIQEDGEEADETKKGVNLILKPDSIATTPRSDRIRISLRNVPLGQAINTVATLAGLKVQIDQFAVVLSPTSARH